MTHRLTPLAFALLVLAAMLLPAVAACTDSNDDGDDVLARFNADGTAWLSLNIQTDNDDTGLTRATTDGGFSGDDDLIDGSIDAVANDQIYILFFQGDTEAEAKFVKYHQASLETQTERPQGAQVSRQAVALVTDEGLKKNTPLWVFVVLNANANVKAKLDDALTATSTLSTLQGISIAGTGDQKYTAGDKTYYLMTNSPVTTVHGGDNDPTPGTVSTLVPVRAGYFFSTREEAKGNPAATIYVERTLAKITVTAATQQVDGKYRILIAGNENLAIEKLQVALDRYNTTSKLARSFDVASCLKLCSPNAKTEASTYRFADAAPMLPGVTAADLRYRTYWATDHNPGVTHPETGNTGMPDVCLSGTQVTDGDTYHTLFDAKSGTADEGLADATPQTFDCAENTFGVDHMDLACSTQLLIRAQVYPGTFYTITSTGEEFGEVVNPSLWELGTSASSSFGRRRAKAEDMKSLDEYLRDWLMEAVTELATWVKKYADDDPQHLTIRTDKDDPDANPDDVQVTVSQSLYTSGTAKTEFEGTVTTAIQAALAKVTIKVFSGGWCYYRLPIRHFTDDQTPWELQKGMQQKDVAHIYKKTAKEGVTTMTDLTDDEANNLYLGRYGVVRNNWYSVKINSITRMGDPTPAYKHSDLGNIADDNPSQFISLKMSVLPWIEIKNEPFK